MNIQQAALLVGRQIGLPSSFDGSVAAINALDDEHRLALTAGLGAYIRANPSDFTSQQVSVANGMPVGFQQNDSSFDVSDFLVAVADNADELIVKPLENIGASASAVAKAAPLILILVGAFLLITWTRAKGAQISS